MKGKYMKVKRVVLSTLTVVMIASQLCGCAAVSKDELEEMISETETVTIETAEPLIVGERETREDSESTEAETESETATSAKTIEDLVKEVAKVSDFTEEELESIAEDARVYEAYGSDAETAFDMAMKDAVYGKSNGQQDYAVTLPQVVDENGNPYPTDEYGGVIIPETTAPEETTQVAENETPTSEKPYAGLEITLDERDEDTGRITRIYGDNQYYVIIDTDGTEYVYDNLTEALNRLSILDYEKTQEELAAAGFVEWDGTLSGKDSLAMTDEELRQSMNDPNSPNGYIQ